MRNNDTSNKVKVFAIGMVLILIVFGFFFFSPIVNVPAGQVGVKFDSIGGGVSNLALGEGWNVIIPIVQSVYLMDARTIKQEYTASAASSDLQIVTSKVAVSYHIQKSNAPAIYKELGLDYSDKIIGPAVQERFKASTARFKAEELIQNRETVKNDISNSLRESLSKYQITLDEVSILDFEFSSEFNTAIEQKVVAEQGKLTAMNVLQIKQVEAQQRVAEAEGLANAKIVQAQADANATIMIATANARALELQKVQVSDLLIRLREIEKWDGKLPTYVGGGVVPVLGVGQPVNISN